MILTVHYEKIIYEVIERDTFKILSENLVKDKSKRSNKIPKKVVLNINDML